ncbi:MAG TPA: hypothetical protein PL117_01710 [Accumulibacter sp.]|uniref:hypothetical protein n=1 Tax=Accumulibacter sp. TaxID=2053492 RepID=UPI002CED5622|nr:hypothetical protein [Accumulibacter sp.]HRF71465.1 hypothetical protein [Accumulibacter sp.]
MNATEIIEKVAGEGVLLALSPAGTITVTGDEQVVDRWLQIIRDNKPDILRELRREGRRMKVLAMLGADPDLRYAVHVDAAAVTADPVLVVVGIRSVATFELEIPRRHYDGLTLLELVAEYSGAKHANS